MRGTRAVLAIGLLLMSGCTSTTSGSPTQTPMQSPTATPAAARSALATALSRVPAAALGKGGYFEFGDSAALRQLATTNAALWKNQRSVGTGGLFSYGAYTAETIGVDLSSASYALDVGQPPQSVIVVAGGQDESRIKATAMKSGWTGTDVLSKKLNIDKDTDVVTGIAFAAPKIRPLGSDVVLSQPDGDPVAIAATGAAATLPADQVPGAKATISCLGDLPVAYGAGITSADPSVWTAAGAGGGTAATASSVLCLGAADTATANQLATKVRTALATGTSKHWMLRWNKLLPSATVDVLPGSPSMVRVTARTQTADLVLQLMDRLEIPGR